LEERTPYYEVKVEIKNKSQIKRQRATNALGYKRFLTRVIPIYNLDHTIFDVHPTPQLVIHETLPLWVPGVISSD
jgi:hypothetical protein